MQRELYTHWVIYESMNVGGRRRVDENGGLAKNGVVQCCVMLT